MRQTPAVEQHPWNTEFTWVDRAGPFCRITQEQADPFDRDGFIVLDDVFSDAGPNTTDAADPLG